MICNHCQYPCGEQEQFCTNCGAMLNRPVAKGRHWVPILIMIILSVCCTALFYALPLNDASGDLTAHNREMPWFSLEDGVLHFDSSAYTGGSQLTVPGEIGGRPVTAIADGCFRDCSDLSAVILPESLEAIGEEAFKNCSALRGIEIPQSVTFIGKDAFEGCSHLEAICLSRHLRYVGSNAFADCSNLHYVYFLGDFQEWTKLYQDFIPPTVVISCDDGKFYQDGSPA